MSNALYHVRAFDRSKNKQTFWLTEESVSDLPKSKVGPAYRSLCLKYTVKAGYTVRVYKNKEVTPVDTREWCNPGVPVPTGKTTTSPLPGENFGL